MSELLHLKVHSSNNKKKSNSRSSSSNKRGFGYSGRVSSDDDTARKSSSQNVHTVANGLKKYGSNKYNRSQWVFSDEASFESSFVHKGELSPDKYDDNKTESFPSFSKIAKSKARSFQATSFLTAQHKTKRIMHDSESEVLTVC